MKITVEEGAIEMTGLIERARSLALLAHRDQLRKYTHEPYWLHCREVAFLVEAAGGTEEMIAAAWLHDVVEDTEIEANEIFRDFGTEVGEMVMDLTDISRPSDGNRAARKEIDRKHTAAASPKAKTVKLADLISNSTSIARYDKDFAVVYMREKEILLPYLYGDNSICDHSSLYTLAERILRRYRDGNQNS